MLRGVIQFYEIHSCTIAVRVHQIYHMQTCYFLGLNVQSATWR